MEKKSWSTHVYNSIAWDSFAIAFNKLTSSQQTIMKKPSSASGALMIDTDATEVKSKTVASVVLKMRTGDTL
jgi:hypothetical protein